MGGGRRQRRVVRRVARGSNTAEPVPPPYVLAQIRLLATELPFRGRAPAGLVAGRDLAPGQWTGRSPARSQTGPKRHTVRPVAIRAPGCKLGLLVAEFENAVTAIALHK